MTTTTARRNRPPIIGGDAACGGEWLTWPAAGGPFRASCSPRQSLRPVLSSTRRAGFHSTRSERASARRWQHRQPRFECSAISVRRSGIHPPESPAAGMGALARGRTDEVAGAEGIADVELRAEPADVHRDEALGHPRDLRRAHKLAAGRFAAALLLRQRKARAVLERERQASKDAVYSTRSLAGQGDAPYLENAAFTLTAPTTTTTTTTTTETGVRREGDDNPSGGGDRKATRVKGRSGGRDGKATGRRCGLPPQR